MFAALLAGAKARLLPILGGLVAALIAAAALLYWRLDAVAGQRDAQDARADRAELALKSAKDNEKEVIRYVDRKVEVVKSIPVIRERLVAGVCHEVTLPVAGAGDSPAAAQPEAGDGIAGPLAEEIAACLAEAEQLRTLSAVIKRQQRTK